MLDSIIESNQVLKRSGGNFRQYLFSFYDQNYQEWTLIPDLSLASVKKYIESKTNKKIKWSYSGEAYRKRDKSNKSPIVKQIGWEIFGSYNKAKDDSEIIQTSLPFFTCLILPILNFSGASFVKSGSPTFPNRI